jgi:hypothetical protein
MASKYWIKLYHEILHDPKMGTMPDHLWRRAIEMMLLAGDTNADGYLPNLKEMAWVLRYDQDELGRELAELEKVGLLTNDNGRWLVTNFTARQDAMPAAERSRRFRNDSQQAQWRGNDVESPTCNEQRNEPETNSVTKANVDIDIDTDIDKETGAANAARAHDVIPFSDDVPDEQSEPTQRKRAKPRPDARTDHPAIQAIRHVSGRLPAKAQYDVLINALGAAPPDEALLKRCYDAWVLKGWNPGNLAWATEWYAQGGPPQTHKQTVTAPVNGATEHSQDEWAAIAAQFNGGRT